MLHELKRLHRLTQADLDVALIRPADYAQRDRRAGRVERVEQVVDGEIDVYRAAGEPVAGGPGFFAVFDPGERHEVRARSDARLLLVLAPWPGDGHPGARDA